MMKKKNMNFSNNGRNDANAQVKQCFTVFHSFSSTNIRRVKLTKKNMYMDMYIAYIYLNRKL